MKQTKTHREIALAVDPIEIDRKLLIPNRPGSPFLIGATLPDGTKAILTLSGRRGAHNPIHRALKPHLIEGTAIVIAETHVELIRDGKGIKLPLPRGFHRPLADFFSGKPWDAPGALWLNVPKTYLRPGFKLKTQFSDCGNLIDDPTTEAPDYGNPDKRRAWQEKRIKATLADMDVGWGEPNRTAKVAARRRARA